MRVDDWDQELAVIQGDLARIAAYLERSARITGRSERSKAKFLQARVRFERLCDQMGKVLGGEYLLVMQEKALVHWCRVYLEKVQSLYQIRQQTMTRGLWIKLLKARMLGSLCEANQVSSEPNSEDLVTLAVRHGQLQNTEQQLKAQIASLEAWKDSLRERYYKLGVIQANRVAGRTLSSRYDLGPSGERVSGLLSSLGKAIVKANWISRREGPEKAFMERVQSYVRATEESLNRCQNITVAQLAHGEKIVHQEGSGGLGQDIGKLAALEAEVQSSYESLVRRPLPPLRPIIVQKKRKKATTLQPETSVG